MRYISIAVLVVSVAFTASRGVAQGRDPLEFMPPEAWGNIPPEVVARILAQRKRIVYVSIGPIQEQVRTRDGVRDTDDCLVLNSQDRISGRLVGITPEGLVEIQNPFFVKPVKFHVRDVRRIIPARKDKILAGPDTIFLTNGLRISGTVLTVTDEAVSLETASMGRVSIKKNVIASITFRATENVVLDTNFSSGSASPWQRRAGRWVIRDGRFRCLTFLSWTHAPLRQEGPMTFEWTVSELSNQPSGAVMFFVEDVAGIWSENAIYVQPTWNSIQVLRVQRSHTPIIFSKRFGRAFSRATFRAAYDPETGRLKLWVNGFALGECFIRPIVKRGRFINLYARNASVFEHVRVVRGAEGVAGRITPHKTLDQVVLISKDKVSGKVISFSDGIARVETAYGSLAFKKQQIHRIVFHTKDLRRMTRREGDATVAFYGGAVLPVRVNSMSADSLQANIDFLGDVNISRKAIRLLIAPTNTLALDLGSGVSLKMALIPAGSFAMPLPMPAGAPKRPPPTRNVTISRRFYMGAGEVTRGQFAAFVKLTKYKTDAEKKGFSYVYKDGAFVNDKGRHWRNPGISQKDDHPVVCVSWNDAMAFCKWLSERTGRKVRLPTEAEWEYACRAGTDTSYHFGNTVSPGEANFDGSPTGGVFRQKTVSVASFTPNRWYLYGMHGNAAEWCTDWHTPTIPPGDVVDPQGPPSRPHRVFRGGTWYSFAEDIRADSRGGIGPDYRNWGLGFRIVMETK